MKRVRSLLAPIGDVLCGRFSIGAALERFDRLASLQAVQNSILRYSRLPVCATSGGRVKKVYRSKFGVRGSWFDVFLTLRKSDAAGANDRTESSSNLPASGDESEPPALPWFQTWRGVYVFVVACFVLYIVLLTVLSRAFS
jgi:hypothetical protein